MSWGRGLHVVVGGLMLASCTDYQPVHWGGLVPWEQARKAIYSERREASRLVPENARHVVMPGESVSELAALYRVELGDLVALNRLSRPYTIYVGQVLQLPQAGRPTLGAGGTHIVARGDTFSGIAAARGVPLGDLVALNPTVDPERLRVGMAVRLPGSGATDNARGAAPAPVRAAPGAPGQAVAARPPAQAGPRHVAEVQPAPARPAGDPGASARVPEALPPPAVAPRPSVVADATGQRAVVPPDVEGDAARQRDLATVAAPALSGEGFLWPLQSGAVVSGFGPKADGRRNDGINIAAPLGSIVRAAENGLVVYADEDIAAFGRLLLIRHADGYLTAYAHNETLLVTRGDVVSRGQPVAKVGRSGDVVEPQLHFEIRRGKSAVDPIALLGDAEVSLAQRQ